MKKVLFSAYNLDIGGIETSLVTLLNYLSKKDYDITLVLEKKEGIFLNDLNSNIKIIEYRPCENKNIVLRKIINFYKRLKFLLKYKNKFDFSASYATYSKNASFVARNASKNNVLWGHADYLELFANDKQKVINFFKDVKYDKFRKIVFVAESAKETFIKVFPKEENKVLYCNNLINYEKIIQMSNEKIEIQKTNEYTFINVGRHDEQQKRLTRIIEAAKILKDENENFKIYFVGEGKDTQMYQNLIKQYKLEEQIILLGKKQNPYPYIKLADAVILSSQYEGYPVIFLEALVLDKPIITTDVSDAYATIQNKYGIVTKKETLEIYRAMKKFINEKEKIQEKFSPKEHNEKYSKIIEDLINEKG